MTCEDVRSQLDDYIDGALEGPARRQVGEHLAACPGCGGMAADLARVRDAARALGPIAPPDYLWLEVAGRIRLESGRRSAVSAPAPAAPPRRVRTGWVGLAAAAVLAAATGAMLFEARQPPGPAIAPESAGNAGGQDAVKTIEQDLQQADRLYSDAIQRLEMIADASAGTLDPAVAASLKESRTLLDRAITESRAAVDRDPESAAARSSLLEALRRKVQLLQDTIALAGEMRNGTTVGRAGPAGTKSS